MNDWGQRWWDGQKYVVRPPTFTRSTTTPQRGTGRTALASAALDLDALM